MEEDEVLPVASEQEAIQPAYPDVLGKDANVEAAKRSAALSEDFVDLSVRGFRSVNAASGIWQWAKRTLQEPDPNFSLEENWESLTMGLPEEYHEEFRVVRSAEEGAMLRESILQEMEDMQVLGQRGVTGAVAMGLSAIVDVDAPLMLLSGGSYLGPKAAATVGRVGLSTAGRTASVARTAAAGVEAGVITETANVLARPTNEWTQIPDAALGGLVFGTALGAAMPRSMRVANAEIERIRAEWEATKASGIVMKDPAPVKQDPNLYKVPSEDTAGAASVREPETPIDYSRADTEQWIERSRQMNRDSGIGYGSTDASFYFANTPVGQASKRLYEAVSKTPVGKDFDKLFLSDSVILQTFAMHAMESPTGIGRSVNRTAPILEQEYTAAIAGPVIPNIRKNFAQYLRETKSDVPTEVAWFDLPGRLRNRNKNVQDYYRAVMDELAARRYDGVDASTSAQRGVPNSVKQMVDALEEGARNGVMVAKGRNGEIAIRGAEELQESAGWFPQVWSGAKIQDAMRHISTKYGIDGRKAITSSMARSYKELHGWSDDVANTVAEAVIAGSVSRSEGVSTSLSRTLNAQDVDYIQKLLRANGETDSKVDLILQRINEKRQEKAAPKNLKHRNDIDPRTRIEGTDLTVMDLLDTDLERVWATYSRAMARAGGLARQGYQLDELDSLFRAANDELRSKGKEPLSEQFIETIKSYYRGGAYGEGINPWIRRMNALTRLSLLNQMALPQLMELGNAIGTVGWSNFLKAAPAEVRVLFNGKKTAAHEQLQYVDSSIIGDHLITAPHLELDEYRFGILGDTQGWTKTLDKLLAKGQRIQGYTSLFYKTNQWMQNTLRSAYAHRLYQIANGNEKGWSDLRWEDMGFTRDLRGRILKYFKDGTVKFQDGRVIDYGRAAWNDDDWAEFSAISIRVSAQAVQKGLVGESSHWVHSSLGSFFTTLRTFQLAALQKQLIRHSRISDATTTGTMIWGAITAGAAYTAREYISGRGERMTPEKLVQGIVNYHVVTSPIIPFTDTALSILGLDDYQIGQYGNKFGQSNNILFQMPVQFSVINRLAGIPKALGHATLGDGLTKNDLWALSAWPILGNAYGVGHLFNAQRMQIDLDKAAKKKQALEAENGEEE